MIKWMKTIFVVASIFTTTTTTFEVQDAVDIVSSIIELWKVVDSHVLTNGDGGVDGVDFTKDLSSILRNRRLQLTEKMKSISKQLDRIETNMVYNVDFTIESILFALPKVIKTQLRINDVKNILDQINLADKEMSRYLANQSQIERHTLEDWAISVSSHGPFSVRGLLGRLHEAVHPNGFGSSGVFDLLRQVVTHLTLTITNKKTFDQNKDDAR